MSCIDKTGLCPYLAVAHGKGLETLKTALAVVEDGGVQVEADEGIREQLSPVPASVHVNVADVRAGLPVLEAQVPPVQGRRVLGLGHSPRIGISS